MLRCLKIPPGKKGHAIEPGARDAQAAQGAELASLGAHRLLPAASEGPPLSRQRLEVRGETAALLPRALEAGPQGGWQGGAIPWLPLVTLGVAIALPGQGHPMTCSQALDAMDDAGAVLLRRLPVTGALPAVFLVHTRPAHHPPHLLLAGAVA